MHDNSNNNDDDGGYQDWNQDPMATVLICLFGVVVLSLMLLLAFSHKLSIRRQERQQQESSEEEQQRLALQKKKEKQKEIELQKQRWLGLMTRFQLSKVRFLLLQIFTSFVLFCSRFVPPYHICAS